MNKIGFNVVIPTLNSESTIKECLSRLSHKSIEVYIIDSYSNDKTEEISKTFKRTNFIKFKWNKQYPKKRNWTLLNIDLKAYSNYFKNYIKHPESEEYNSWQILINFINKEF